MSVLEALRRAIIWQWQEQQERWTRWRQRRCKHPHAMTYMNQSNGDQVWICVDCKKKKVTPEPRFYYEEQE